MFKKKISIYMLIISALAFLIVIACVFAPVCVDVDWRINRTTEFDLFAVERYDGRMGGRPKSVVANSKVMSSEQKKLVYSYISRLKRVDSKNPLNWYVQSYNQNLVRIMFANGVTLYFQETTSVYSDENSLKDCRLTVDNTDFDKWFINIFRDMSEFTDVSDTVYGNRKSSILSPDDLYRIKTGHEKKSQWSSEGTPKLPLIKYDKPTNFVGKNQLNNTQLQTIESIITTLGRAGITYEFGINNGILYDDLLLYVGMRSRYYYDILVDSDGLT